MEQKINELELIKEKSKGIRQVADRLVNTRHKMINSGLFPWQEDNDLATLINFALQVAKIVGVKDGE